MFTSHEYEQQRQAVIDLFTRFVEKRDELLQQVGHDSFSKADLQLLTKEVNKVKENKYLLAIVGESKSGKSMFINALLKKPILPTGILQCTSGIIEIVDTDNPQDKGKVYLKVKYGNKPEAQVEYEHPSDEDTAPIQEQLRRIAAIQDDYRSLPIFQLNQLLTTDKPEQITDKYVESLLTLKDDKGADILENPHKLPADQFRQLVRQYLVDYRDLEKIPVEITVGHPLGFKFSHLRIVDTPGVNARGGLKAATIKYITDANAAIFIHMLKNIASESLQEFVEKSIPKQAKENIFMFLTHRAQSTKEDVEETLREARKLYPEREIKPERIVAVDSMLKRISDELEAGKPLVEFKKDEETKKLISPYILDFGEDTAKIQPALFEDSNFINVESLLREFSEQALSRQLVDIVMMIANGYASQSETCTDEIRLRESKITKTPEAFESEINTLKALLDDYQRILNDFSRLKEKEYTGLGSEINKEFSELAESYTQKLTTASGEDEIRKQIMDFNTDCERRTTSTITKLSEEYTNEMKRVGAEFQTRASIATPRIGLDEISYKAKDRAYETITIYGDRKERGAQGAVAGALLGALYGFVAGGPVGAAIGAVVGGAATGTGEWLEGTPTTTQKQLNREKYKSELIIEAKHMVRQVAGQMTTAIGGLFTSYDKEFQQKLSKIIDQRKKAYDQLKEKKKEAEKFRNEINRLGLHKKAVTEELKLAEAVTNHLMYVTA